MSSSQVIKKQAGILLVDDEPRDVEAVSEILDAAGYRVYTAVNATEAVSLAREHSADIEFLITDIALPGVNGVELHRMLCETVPMLCNVLFVSARSGAEVLRFYGLSRTHTSLRSRFRRMISSGA
jgi:DNA-binding response OmpR family regulator